MTDAERRPVGEVRQLVRDIEAAMHLAGKMAVTLCDEDRLLLKNLARRPINWNEVLYSAVAGEEQ